MELNTERLMRGIFEEFNKMDAFRTRFKNDFFETFRLAVAKLYPVSETDDLVEYLDLMAEEALRVASDVIEKDRTYPEYRQVMELKTFNSLLEKQNISEYQTEEIEFVKHELNNLLLKHYPAIFEFSSFGYRLLDRNVQFFARQFTKALREAAEKAV